MERKRRPPAKRARLRAGWQRALLWAIWLGLLAAVWKNSRSSSLGWIEASLLAPAIAITVWCWWRPLGIPKVIIRKPEQVLGEFASRTSWSWLLFSVFLTL